jgi:branched-chain amino acid transport system substrate-binding protein
LDNKVILRRYSTFPLILCVLLSLWYLLIFSGDASAQSLLSDRAWLENNTEVTDETETVFRIEPAGQNTPLLPSDLLSAPTTLLEVETAQTESSVPNISTSSLTLPIPTLSLIEAEEHDRSFSGSFFNNIFPWFSKSDQNSSNNAANDSFAENEPVETQSEWANTEFTGIFMLVAEIERLLISNPDAARERYQEIEHQLEIEERTRIKVQLLYQLNEWSSAEILAKAFLSERQQSPLSPLIFYYLNKALLSQNKALSQNLVLRERTAKTLEPNLRSDYLRMLSDEALLQGDLFSAIQYRLDELSNVETAKMADLEKLLRLLKEVQFVEKIHNLSVNFPNLTWLQEKIPLLKLELLVKQKHYREALELLDQQLELAHETSDLGQIELLEQTQSSLTTALNLNPRRIGVILPLSSSSAKVAGLAQETLNGLWLALRAYENTVVNDNISNNTTSQTIIISRNLLLKDNVTIVPQPLKIEDSWELVVRDSHLDPEKTKNAIRELVETEGVIAVIGPLARKTSEAAAEEAERLRVPLISLSLTAGVPELGDYIFRNNQSWKQEVQELLDYAVSELQACRFLILYAKTREGRQKMRLFWEAAVLKGCEVVAVEGFKNVGQKSLVNEFDTFTGKRKRISATEKSILKQIKEKEVPIHNFDAVFVAVGSGGVKNLRLIFPYSAVYKMGKAAFLGDSGWNDAALPFAPGLRGVKKPIFVDSFFPQSKTPAMQQLLRLHERILYQHQNYLGPTHYTAYAYDTLMILMKLLKEERNQSHSDLRSALANMQIFPGVTGNLRFDEKGEIQREMQILTLHRGKIKLLKK